MADPRGNSRLEAFSDGVFAIALTLLIIEIHAPDAERIGSQAALWHALAHRLPAVLAFLLSFAVILITWVNHHGAMRLIKGSSSPFIYANGFMLLIVVMIPFPTAFLGAFLGTPYAGPAVILYDAILAAQALSWVLFFNSALVGELPRDESATVMMRTSRRHGYQALGLYTLLAVLAVWIPITVAIITAATWVFWLVLSIRVKNA